MTVTLLNSIVGLRAAIAADYNYSLGYKMQYSDNVGLVPTNEQHDLIHGLTGTFQLSQSGRELDASVNASAEHKNYQHNVFADDTAFGLNGSLLWKPVPDVLHWSVDDVYTQLATTATGADTPANRVNANVFSTGPDVFWRLSAVQTLQLGGRYAINSFSSTKNTATTGTEESDNTRRGGTLRWLYRSSPVTTFSVAYTSEATEFDDPVIAGTFDFRRSESTVGVVNNVGRNNFAIDVGKTRIKRINQPEFSGASGRLSWVREVTAETSISLTASRALSDTSQEVLAAAQGIGAGTTTTSISTADVFTSRAITAAYSHHSGSTNLGLSLFRAEREFELAMANDEEAKGANVEYKYAFTPSVSGAASASYVKTLFPSTTREDRTRVASLGLQYNFTRTVSAGLGVARQVRSSTDPGSEYVENSALLSLVYNSLPSRW